MAMRLLDRRWPFPTRSEDAIPIAVGFALLLILVHMMDAPVARAMQGLPDWLVGVMHGLTRFGESDWILVPSLIVALLCWLLAVIVPPRPLKRAAAGIAWVSAFIFFGVGVPSLVATLLKRLFGRARPSLLDTVGDLAFHPNWGRYAYQGFPSGHATTAFALAVVVSFIQPRLAWLMVAFAIAVAASRVALGEHYLTDVTAGALLGTFGAYAIRNVFVARGHAFRGPDKRIRFRTAAVLRAFRRPRPGSQADR